MKNTTSSGLPQALPQAMVRAKRWLLWKANKQPFYADGTPRRGRLDTPEDAKRLVTYAEAAKALAKATPSPYAGLGFALGGGWQGLDLDGVRDAATGAVEPWAHALVEASGSYAEVSPSGKGLHVIGRGEPFKAMKGEGIEFYSGGRYFTVTGQVYNGQGKKLADLNPIYLGVTRERPATPPAPPVTPGVTPIDWAGNKREAQAILRKLDPDMSYPEWVKVGMVLYNASGGHPDALQLWDAWSAHGAKYTPGVCDARWAGFKDYDGPRVSMGSLVHMEREQAARKKPKVEPSKAGTLPTEFKLGSLSTMNIPPTAWLVDKLVAPGLTLMASPPKHGKSYLALQMAICVGEGREYLGRATRPQRVAYFDLEEWHALLLERYTAIKAAHAPDGDCMGIDIVLETGVGDEAFEHIQRKIDEGCKLIIIDLLAKVRDEMSEDAKQNAYARDYSALSRFAQFAKQNPDVGIVVVHHTNKRGAGSVDDWQELVSGSQGVTGATHTNVLINGFDLRGKTEDEKAELRRYRRVNVVGKLVKADEFIIEMMPNDGGWALSTESADDVTATQKQARVLFVLRQKPGVWMTTQDIADITGMKHPNVRQIMRRMAHMGLIESDGQGGAGYRVPAR